MDVHPGRQQWVVGSLPPTRDWVSSSWLHPQPSPKHCRIWRVSQKDGKFSLLFKFCFDNKWGLNNTTLRHSSYYVCFTNKEKPRASVIVHITHSSKKPPNIPCADLSDIALAQWAPSPSNTPPQDLPPEPRLSSQVQESPLGEQRRKETGLTSSQETRGRNSRQTRASSPAKAASWGAISVCPRNVLFRGFQSMCVCLTRRMPGLSQYKSVPLTSL